MKVLLVAALALCSACSAMEALREQHADVTIKQLCQATDLHQYLQTEQQKKYLAQFCTAMGYPLEASAL